MKFLITVVLGMIFAIIHSIYKIREEKKRTNRLSQAALKEAFGELDGAMPVIEVGSSYGYPSYSVKFESKEQMDEAETKGRNKIFLQSIQRMHRNIASFESERAVFFTYEGQTFNFIEVDSSGNPIRST